MTTPHSQNSAASRGAAPKANRISTRKARRRSPSTLHLRYVRLRRGGRRVGEPRGLEGEHVGVVAAGRDQFVVRALLGHAPVVEDDDAVGAADGGETVGDD